MSAPPSVGSLAAATVYVILPVHNRRDITLAFVECLKKQSYRNFRLLLIDDGSTDGTADAVKKVMANAEVILGNGQWWWAGCLQQAYRWFERNRIPAGDVVLIMNDDTAFDEQFIATGLRVLDANPRTLLTATGYNLKTGQPQDSGGYILNWENLGFAETCDNSKMNCASTRGLMVRVGDFLDVNGFHPRLIPHYLSDLEFTMRAQKLGKKLMIHPDFRIGIDFETTGYREHSEDTFTGYLRRILSKRAAMNPVHWSNYILLHSPWKYKVSNLRRIWGAVYQQGVRERLVPRMKRRFRGHRKSAGNPPV
jgi:GT2 family glycosyltransferase